jgi:hypothetical protein
MEARDINEVIDKLIGPTTPIGESGVDADRLENMKKLIEVFNRIHIHIDHIAYRFEDSPRHSEAAIGKLASKHIESMGIE